MTILGATVRSYVADAAEALVYEVVESCCFEYAMIAVLFFGMLAIFLSGARNNIGQHLHLFILLYTILHFISPVASMPASYHESTDAAVQHISFSTMNQGTADKVIREVSGANALLYISDCAGFSRLAENTPEINHVLMPGGLSRTHTPTPTHTHAHTHTHTCIYIPGQPVVPELLKHFYQHIIKDGQLASADFAFLLDPALQCSTPSISTGCVPPFVCMCVCAPVHMCSN